MKTIVSSFLVAAMLILISNPAFASNVKIEIFNMLGQRMAIIVNDHKTAGFYEFTWNAQNLPSGVYFIYLNAESLNSNKNIIQVKKALLLK